VNPVAAPATFRRALLSWHKKNGRHTLPWRRTADPYAVLVSEVMLQQTQVATAIPYYEIWMRQFPNFTALAAASEREVLRAWQGLGYYTRARNLHACAQQVVAHHGGHLPETPAALAEFPGLGRYSANAIATFAFDQAVPIVEANIARLLCRLSDMRVPIDTGAGRAKLWRFAETLVPKSRPGVFNSALMDLGATICIARRPRCALCPVKKFCRARRPEQLPIRKPARAVINLAESHEFIRCRGRILLEQSRGRWQGLWILPRRQKPDGKVPPLHTSTFPVTHHRVRLEVFAPAEIRARQTSERWFPIRTLDSVPLPSPHRRALETILAASAKGPAD
jgi:A/G-specific adenine glycosylase